MAKKKQSKRASRPRRPKRIISGITEFIDDDWWEDSRRSNRGKKRESTDKSSDGTARSSSTKEKKREEKPPKAKTTEKKSSRTEKKVVAKEEPAAQTKSKRKRSRRKAKKSESTTTTSVKEEKLLEEPIEATSKKKRRRRPKSETKDEKTSSVKTKSESAIEQEVSSVKPKRRRRRKSPSESKDTEIQSEKKISKPKKSKKDKAETEEAPRKEKEPVAKPKQKRRDKTKEQSTEEPRSKRKQTKTSEKKASTQSKPSAPTPKPSKKKSAKKRTRKATGFEAMDLSDEMLEALDLAGYSEPTPIQAGLIPAAIKGNDLMGQAQTGTGKTAAFAIPLLETIDYDMEFRGPKALVLVPTRELAVQVRDECAKLAVTGEVKVVAVYGGKPIRRQIEKLRRAPEIVVGTPGRVIDLNARGALFFGDLRQVVLDEADRMLDIGFRPDIEKILRRCPQSRQTLLLSATMPGPVLRLAKRYMRDPETLDFSPKNIAVETIDQFYFTVDPERKFDLLVKLLERENPAQAIIFCRTRRGTEKIYRRLTREKLKSVACIHGDLQQSTRDSTMRKFRASKLQFLVATDVVGRGIDVSGVSHIINYDIPEFCDDYVHRVGRTGRMGREGVAYTFVTPEEGPQLTRIEMRINLLLNRAEMPGFDMGIKEELPDEPDIPSTPKPVYGRSTRRFRRAL